MPRPQTITLIEDEVLSRAPVAESNAAFIVGYFDKGPLSLVPCYSYSEVKATFGDRNAYSSAHDAIETIFRLSQGVVYPLRAIGPTPVFATGNIFDQSGSTAPGDVALIATAKQYGSLFNSWTLAVTVDGTNFEIAVKDEDGATVETSGVLADRAAAVAWSLTSTYVGLTLGASNEDPRAQTVTFASGTDDHASGSTAAVEAALALSESIKGGLVAAPGLTTDAIRAAVAAHGLAYFRKAVMDFADSAVVADHTADQAQVTDLAAANVISGYVPWLEVTGVAAGTSITIPPSAIIIGLYRRNDANGVSINQAAAGPRYGVLPSWVTGVSQTFDSDDQDELADGSVNVIRVENGQVVVNGARTAADPDERAEWVAAPGARTVLTIAAEGDRVLDSYRFAPLGRDTFMKVERDLTDLCLKYAGPPHEVFDSVDNGDGTLDPGYSVDATTVNTAETIADRELHAQLTLRTKEMSESVIFRISKQVIS